MSDSTGPNEDAACEGCELTPAPPENILKEIGLAAMGALLLAGIPAEFGRDDAAAGRGGQRPCRRRSDLPRAGGRWRADRQGERGDPGALAGQRLGVQPLLPAPRTALRWTDAKHEFQCPKHKSRYQPDGTFIAGRATRNMDRFSITHTGTEVIVHVGAMHQKRRGPGKLVRVGGKTLSGVARRR